MEQKHLLIVGPPRSGTTLLTTMVGRHSEVAMLNEDKGWVMRKIVGKQVVGNKRCIPNQIEMRKSIFAQRFLKRLGWIDEYQSSDYSIEDYLGLPGIKIIGITREPDDVIASIIRRNRKNFRVAAARWCRAVEIMDDLAAAYSDVFIPVSFEDLVLEPERNMQRIAAFLGLDYQPCMLEGPRYNPWYPETGMNRDKINEAAGQNRHFNVPEKFPEAWSRYLRLRDLALGKAAETETAASHACDRLT